MLRTSSNLWAMILLINVAALSTIACPDSASAQDETERTESSGTNEVCITAEDWRTCEQYQAEARKYRDCLDRVDQCQRERDNALQQRDENFGRYQEADRLRRQERERADDQVRKSAVLEQEVNRRWKPGKVVGFVVGGLALGFGGGFLVGSLTK